MRGGTRTWEPASEPTNSSTLRYKQTNEQTSKRTNGSTHRLGSTFIEYISYRTIPETMGFWLGTLFFVVLELVGMFLVKTLIGTRRGRRHELLGQVLVATSVICCWLMWAIVYVGQMKVWFCGVTSFGSFGWLGGWVPNLSAVFNARSRCCHLTYNYHYVYLFIVTLITRHACRSRSSTPFCRRDFILGGVPCHLP